LLGCVKQKLDHGAPAKDLYGSSLRKGDEGGLADVTASRS
jgi:hypothetical protein